MLIKLRLSKLMKLFKGFTLIELLVVVAIIGILASLAITSFRFVLLKAQDTRNKSLAGTVGSAIAQYGVDNGNKYPVANGQVDISNLENALSGYLKTNAALTQATGVAKYSSNFDGSSFVAGWELKNSADQSVLKGNGVYTTNSAESPGSVTAGSSAISGGISFDGRVWDDAYPTVQIPHNAAYNGNFTTTFWINPTALSGAFPSFNKTALIGKTNYSSNGWLVSFDNTGFMTQEIFGGFGPSPSFLPGPKLTIDSCNFIVITWDGTDFKSYINNVLSYSRSYFSIPPNNNPIVIGTPNYSFDYFKGIVDDLRIYNTILTGPQLSQLYNLSQGGRGAFGGSGEMNGALVGGWRMDDGGVTTPTEVSDYSTIANHGILSLTSWSNGCTSLGLSGLGSSLTGKAFVVYGPQ